MAAVSACATSSSSSLPAWRIPVDYTLSKGFLGLFGGDLTVHDAQGNLAYRVVGGSSCCCPSCKPSSSRARTLVDALGAPMISVLHHANGLWQGFRGNCLDFRNSIFTVQKTKSSPFKEELDVYFASENFGQPSCSLRLRGNPFQRSCTVYSGRSIVAQTNIDYKLGKVIHSRHKFRLTIYPGIDHALVMALLVIFYGGNLFLP